MLPKNAHLAVLRLFALSAGVVALVAVFVQLVLGAWMRHTEAGLAVPFFPLSAGGDLLPEFVDARVMVHMAHRGFAVVVAGLLGIFPPGFVSQVVAFAFGLAAASFFPAIVLGIFSKRVGTVPAMAGMIAGIGFTAFYIIGGVYGGMPNWCFGIDPQGIGTVGMLINFGVTLALTPFTRAPSQSVRDMIDRIHEPEGAGPAVVIEAAPEH